MPEAMNVRLYYYLLKIKQALCQNTESLIKIMNRVTVERVDQ